MSSPGTPAPLPWGGPWCPPTVAGRPLGWVFKMAPVWSALGCVLTRGKTRTSVSCHSEVPLAPRNRFMPHLPAQAGRDAADWGATRHGHGEKLSRRTPGEPTCPSGQQFFQHTLLPASPLACRLEAGDGERREAASAPSMSCGYGVPFLRGAQCPPHYQLWVLA